MESCRLEQGGLGSCVGTKSTKMKASRLVSLHHLTLENESHTKKVVRRQSNHPPCILTAFWGLAQGGIELHLRALLLLHSWTSLQKRCSESGATGLLQEQLGKVIHLESYQEADWMSPSGLKSKNQPGT